MDTKLLEAGGLAVSPYQEDSRYRGLAIVSATLADGRRVRCLTRRMIPPLDSFALLEEHEVVAGDRLDSLAARYFGDPLLFWRIADANDAMSPDELTAVAGRRLRITQASGEPGFADEPGDL